LTLYLNDLFILVYFIQIIKVYHSIIITIILDSFKVV